MKNDSRFQKELSSPPRKPGSRACPWHEQGAAAEALPLLDSRFRRNDEKERQLLEILGEMTERIFAQRWAGEDRRFPYCEAGSGETIVAIVSEGKRHINAMRFKSRCAVIGRKVSG